MEANETNKRPLDLISDASSMRRLLAGCEDVIDTWVTSEGRVFMLLIVWSSPYPVDLLTQKNHLNIDDASTHVPPTTQKLSSGNPMKLCDHRTNSRRDSWPPIWQNFSCNERQKIAAFRRARDSVIRNGK